MTTSRDLRMNATRATFLVHEGEFNHANEIVMSAQTVSNTRPNGLKCETLYQKISQKQNLLTPGQPDFRK